MKTLINNKTKFYILVGSLALLTGGAGTSFAAKAKPQKQISVTVAVNKYIAKNMHVFGVGFSVNNESRGSMGTRTTKTGPAYAKYSFGFKSYRGSDISCGSSVLKRDSRVIIYYKGNKCTHKVFAKESKS